MNMLKEPTELKETHCPRLAEWDGLAAANFCQDKKSVRRLTAKGSCTLI